MTTSPEQRTAPTPVEMWFDPLCPWAWLTSRWLIEVERVRPVEVTWSLMSLAVLNEQRIEQLPQEYAELMAGPAWRPARVVAAAEGAHGAQVLRPLYDAIGTRLHPGGEKDYDVALRGALEEVGLPLELLEAADSSDLDDTLRAGTARATGLVGDDVGTPVVAVDGVAFFGPVLTPAPRGEAAGRLWDGCVLVAGTPGFYELKRSRTSGPIFDEKG